MTNNKRKILFMLHVPPPVHGSSIVGEIIKNNNLLNNSYNTSHINLLVSGSISETGKFKLRKVYKSSIIWFKLLVHLVLRKPDLCYYALSTTGFAFFKDCMMISLLRIFNVKTIFHLHNKGIKSKQNKWCYNILYKFTFKKSSVILLSKHLYYDIDKFVSVNNTYYCPNGLEDMNDVEKTAQKDDFVRILFLSNLIKSKGVFDLIDSCQILENKGLKFKCDFIGGEGDITKEEFEEYVSKRGLLDKVKYLGKKFDIDKSEAYKKSDIFVFPTYYPNECFPLVLIEAMQFGLPIISTFEGGIPDMIDENINGLLIEQRDPQLIADKIEYLIKNPQIIKEMGIKGREKYLNNYTIDLFDRNIYSVLKKELSIK